MLNILALNHFMVQVVKADVISSKSSGSCLCHEQNGNCCTKILCQEEDIYFSMYIYKLGTVTTEIVCSLLDMGYQKGFGRLEGIWKKSSVLEELSYD